MYYHPAPSIGAWYQLQEYPHQLIEVVAIDNHTDTITIQCVDGELDELDAEQWPELLPIPVEDSHWARAAYFAEEIEPEDLNETEWDDIDSAAPSHFFIPT